ncbi:MAG: hypothetical protein HYW28_00010 [Rhodospirillales bacterium]|nr:hypothetical protein [Rhodospirillales bacterium]
MLGKKELEIISQHFDTMKSSTKKEILTFFQEKLATGEPMDISTGARNRFKKLFVEFEKMFD